LDVLEFVFSLWVLGDVDILLGVISVIVEFLSDDFLCFSVAPFSVAEVFGSYRVALVSGSVELAETYRVLLVPFLWVKKQRREGFSFKIRRKF